MLSYLYLCERLSKKHHYAASDVLNDSWRRHRISTRQQNQLAKGRTCKNRRTKIHKLTNALPDALLTGQNGDNKASRAYIENMPEPRGHISQNRRII